MKSEGKISYIPSTFWKNLYSPSIWWVEHIVIFLGVAYLLIILLHQSLNFPFIDKQYIVIAGGDSSDQYTSSDIFDFDTMTWTAGPTLPNDVCYAANVQYGNTFLKVGGYCSNTILEFDPICMDWIVRDEEYHYDNDNPAAVMVDDSIQASFCIRM